MGEQEIETMMAQMWSGGQKGQKGQKRKRGIHELIRNKMNYGTILRYYMFTILVTNSKFAQKQTISDGMNNTKAFDDLIKTICECAEYGVYITAFFKEFAGQLDPAFS